MSARILQRKLRSQANPTKAKLLQRFFKTGPGEYGAGDRFLGVTVPQTRAAIKEYRDLPLAEIKRLLRSPFHEERLAALLILALQFPRAPAAQQKKIYHFYLASTASINSWDLVDLSAPHIVGAYLADKNRQRLYMLARSPDLWQRRIAVLATFSFIRHGDFADALALARLLITDKEDLMHKATGWMLREIGKRDRRILEQFLTRHSARMPRTMLRYAIERLPQKARRSYLKRKS